MSVPESFLKVKAEADKLVESDERFKDALATMQKRYNKKNKQNKLGSAKMRFYIGHYLVSRKKELKLKQGEKSENAKGSEGSSEEKTSS